MQGVAGELRVTDRWRHRAEAAPGRAEPAGGEVPLIRIIDAVMAGTSVLVTGPGDMAPLLNDAARRLARTRVIRIRPPFGLPDFINQVAAPGTGQGTSPKTDHDEADVERAFRALTELDAGCERIALLVEGAHDMPHPTLRYVEMALFTAAHLHVVLAGTPALADTLALAGFIRLHNRVPVRVSLPDAAAPVLAHFLAQAAPVPTPTAMPPWPFWPPWPRRVPRSGVLAIWIMTGIAASVALAVLASWSMQAPHGAAVPALPGASLATGPSSADPPAASAPATMASPAVAPTPLPVMAAVVTEAPAPVLPDAAPVPSALPTGGDEPIRPLAAGQAQVPDSTEPAPAPAAPPVLAAVARPVSPPRMQPRLVPIRPDRVTVEKAPAANQDERRCRGIIQHLQLGEDPTDADRAFLRSGCR